jgi:anti-sigma factor RsiW
VEHKFHGTDDQLEQYALGRLPESDLPLLEEHLMVCPDCQERLDGIENFALGMREALGTEYALKPVAAPKTDWFGWMRRPAFSMALAFAALIIAVGIFSTGRMKFAPSASLQLTAMRGEMPVTVPAREFELTLSDGPRAGGPFRVEVVNAVGSSMWSGLEAGSPAGVQVKVQQRLGPGDYFVRLYDASGKMLREYGFRVHA